MEIESSEELPPPQRARSNVPALIIIGICGAIAAWWYWKPLPVEVPVTAAGTRVNAIRFSPGRSPKYVAAAFSDGRVRVWETSKRQEVPVKLPSQLPLSDLAWDADGTMLFTGGFEQHVLIWNAKSSVIRKMPMFPAPVVAICSRPHKQELLVSLSTGELWWVDLESGNREAISTGHQGTVKVIRYHPDGDAFVTGGADNQIVWHAAETRQVTRKLAAHDHEVSSLAFSANGVRLVSGSWDNTAKVWQPDGVQPSETFTHPDGVALVEWQGDDVVTSCWDGRLRLWNVGTSQVAHERGCYADTRVFAVWPGHPEVAEVDSDGELRLSAP